MGTLGQLMSFFLKPAVFLTFAAVGSLLTLSTEPLAAINTHLFEANNEVANAGSTIQKTCIFGFLVALYALYIEYMSHKTKGKYKAVCDMGENMCCTRVLTSKYSSLLYLPNAFYGALFYVGVFVMAGCGYFDLIHNLALLACIGSCCLAYILYVLKDVCLVCIGIYLANVTLYLQTLDGSIADAASRLLANLDHFLYHDTPALDGRMRIIVYGALLLLCYFSYISRPHMGDSPMNSPELLRHSYAEMVTREGVMKYLKPLVSVRSLTLVRNVTAAAWIAVIVGFGGHLPVVLTGLGFLFLSGTSAGLIGTSHRWYIPMYTLVSLAFANGNANYSLDRLFSDAWPESYPFSPIEHGILRSGLGTKLATVFAAYSLTSGAVAKFANGGLRWMDGTSLGFYCSNKNNGHCMWLKRLIGLKPIGQALSVASIALEVFGVMVAWAGESRLFFTILFMKFHLGIWLTMWPNYLPQSFCYILMLDLFAAPGSTVRAMAGQSTALVSALCVLTFAALFACSLARTEYWPITSVPMYSFYRRGYNMEFLKGMWQLKALGKEYADARYPHTLGWSDSWIEVVVNSPDGRTVLNCRNLANGKVAGFVLKQYRRHIHDVAAKHAVNPDAGIAEAFLRDIMIPVIRKAAKLPASPAQALKLDGSETICLAMRVADTATGTKLEELASCTIAAA